MIGWNDKIYYEKIYGLGLKHMGLKNTYKCPI